MSLYNGHPVGKYKLQGKGAHLVTNNGMNVGTFKQSGARVDTVNACPIIKLLVPVLTITCWAPPKHS